MRHDFSGAPVLQVDSLATFLRAVGTPHDVVWDERTHGEEVRVDTRKAVKR